ncbi:MAG TPA: very short patch repair endonuclease [Blastocatellia bacterium]
MLRRELRLLGLRGYRKHVSLPGKPDLLFPRVGLVVFVDGCFWHGCPRHFKAPKSNAKYWTEKISYNKARDRRNDRRLRRLGYSVVHVWQHRIISDPARAAKAIASALDRRAFTSCQGEC